MSQTTEEPIPNTTVAENPPAAGDGGWRAFYVRYFWFIAGSGVNYLLISLPFKLMLFVLVDGWTLVMGTLASSFYS